MKDAKGHGSESRGGSDFAPGAQHIFKPNIPAAAISGQFSRGNISPRYAAEDTKRTVSDLRARMSDTGPGHAAALWQGIKNLVGGGGSKPAAPSGYTGFGKRGFHG